MTDDVRSLTPSATFGAAEEILRVWLEEPEMAALMAGPLYGLRAIAGESPGLGLPAMVAIPGLVHAAIRGTVAPAVPLCGAAALLFLGVDLLDDVMDGDITPYWQGRNPAEHLLVAATLLQAPAACFARLPVSPEVRADLHARTARALGLMATGQQSDIAAAGDFRTPPDVILQAAAGKAGAMTSMLARWGAVLAGANDDIGSAYSEWGAAYGTAGQLRSEVFDLQREPACIDLARGTATYPLTLLVDATPEPEKEEVIALIRGSAEDAAARATLRDRLQTSGAIAGATAQIQWFETLATAALERADPLEPSASALRAFIETPGTRARQEE